MHLQRASLRIITIILCTCMIVSTFLSTPLTVRASNKISIEKILDMTASEFGAVCSEAVLDNIKEYLYDFLLAKGDSYLAYLNDNGLENNPASWIAFCDSIKDSMTDAEYAFLTSFTATSTVNSVYGFFDEQIEENSHSESKVLQLLGLWDVVKGETYTISSQFVNFIKGLFEEEIVPDMGYYYIQSITAEEVPAIAFSKREDYDDIIEISETLGNNVIYLFHGYDPSRMCMRYLRGDAYLCKDPNNLEKEHALIAYTSGWSVYNTSVVSEVYLDTVDFTADTYANPTFSARFYTVHAFSWFSSDANMGVAFITSDGRPLIVFNSLDAIKGYTTEQAPYYVTSDYPEYSTSTDNSITYTGDYMIKYGDTTTYGEITTNNDYSQDTIDNSVTNITNNYYYGDEITDGDDSGSNDDSNGGSIFDGLGSLISGLTDFLNFILTACGELLTLVTTALTTFFNMIVGFAESFAGFAQFIGDIFDFMPQELIDLLTAGLSFTIIIGIVKQLIK